MQGWLYEILARPETRTTTQYAAQPIAVSRSVAPPRGVRMLAARGGTMEPLPSWMRRALFATAGMNILAALGFLPGATAVRALAGLPQDGQPLYLLTVALFVGLFGLGYL